MYEFGCKITLVFSDLYVIFRQSFVIFRQIQSFFTSKSPKMPISSKNGLFHKSFYMTTDLTDYIDFCRLRSLGAFKKISDDGQKI